MAVQPQAVLLKDSKSTLSVGFSQSREVHSAPRSFSSSSPLVLS